MQHPDDGTLHALLDGEIPSGELPAVQAHLDRCDACRARLDEARAFAAEADGLIVAIEVPDAPGVAARPAAPRPTARPVRSLAWAASLVAAVALGWAARGLRVAPADPASSTVQLAVEDAVPPAPASRPAEQAPPAGAPPTGPVPEAGATRAPAASPAPVARDDRAPSDAAGGRLPGPAGTTAERETAATPPAVVSTRQALAAEPEPAGAVPLRARAAAVEEAKALERREAADADAAFGPVTLEEAVRRLGGTIRLVDGLLPRRVEAMGPVVRVRYPAAGGDLVLELWREGDTLRATLTGPPTIGADSLARLRERIR